MSIQNSAMLVSLTVKQWAARKYDKRVSHEVAKTHNTDVDVGRYNKQLLEKSADSFVTTHLMALRFCREFEE